MYWLILAYYRQPGTRVKLKIMTELRGESFFYHTLNSFYRSDYSLLAKSLQKHSDWETAWEKEDGNMERAEKEWLRLEKSGIRLVLEEESAYPAQLREIPLPPFGIYLKSTDIPELSAESLAIVGTRKATPEGKAMARLFADKIAASGPAIVSGLALGIDAAAHEGALDGNFKTIAVLPGGLDHIYPRTHESLAGRILSGGGVLLSEYPPGTPILPYRFLERNRIISGLSRGVLVIEAGLRSGSLATARFATEQNRDVFVIPGPVRHPNYKGSNLLIRSGAELVTEPEQILEDWGLSQEKTGLKIEPEDDPPTSLIIGIILENKNPLEIDKISELANLDTRTVSQVLSLLLLTDRIDESPAGYSAKK